MPALDFMDELRAAIEQSSAEELCAFMERNIARFFSTPALFEHYQLVKEADLSACRTLTPRLILAWLAFVCGDNARAFSLAGSLKSLDEGAFADCYERSLCDSLAALMGFSPEDRMAHAKRALDVLPAKDRSFYMANARLTYGQVLSGCEQYRAAAEQFAASYDLFLAEKQPFLAVVALVNALLNRFKLGEFSAVLDDGNRALLMSANFKGETQEYWDVVHLPLGMCCYELNKPNLAVGHLMKAKSSIDKMNLLHMHGLIEYYLFKSYVLLKDKAAMSELLARSVEAFSHMNYKMMDLLLSMFRIASYDGSEPDALIRSDIERFELEYSASGDKNPFILLETMAYLKIKGWSDAVTVADMVASLEKLRFTGLVSYLQLILVLLAQMHAQNGDTQDAADCLREAAMIYKDCGICAAFFAVSLGSVVQLVEKIDKTLYTALRKNAPQTESAHGALLSARERDILRLVAEGRNNEDIGKTLFISVGTVKWHINHIFSKLEAGNRIAAVEKAKRLGEL